MSVIDELKDLAKAIMTEGKAAKESMDEIEEWNSMEDILANIETIQEFFGHVTAAVSEAADKLEDVASNEEKLDAAIEAVKDMVELPFLVEFASGYVLKIMISAAYQAFGKK